MTSFFIQPSNTTLVKSTPYGDIRSQRSATGTYKEFFHLNQRTLDVLHKHIQYFNQRNTPIQHNEDFKHPQIFDNLMHLIHPLNPTFHDNLKRAMQNRILSEEDEKNLVEMYFERAHSRMIAIPELHSISF